MNKIKTCDVSKFDENVNPETECEQISINIHSKYAFKMYYAGLTVNQLKFC